MDASDSPSQKLAARLAGLQADDPRPGRDAAQWLSRAEAAFAIPTSIVRVRWTKHHAGPITYSRAAHQFSDYEAFVFKFAQALLGMGRIEPTLANEIMAAAVYSGGKAAIDNTTGELNESSFAFLNREYKNGAEHMMPQPLDVYADAIHKLIAAQHGPTAPRELSAWVKRHTGDHSKDDGSDSHILSSRSDPYGLPLGIDRKTGQPIFYNGEASLLTVAAPGKGKTQCHVLPALASYRGPVIALDIKGECFRATAEWRKANVGPVMVFNPVTPEESRSYNPLALVRSDPEELWQDSRFLAELLIVPRSTSHDPVWDNQARDLLTLFVAFVAWRSEFQTPRMSLILDLVAGINQAEVLEFIQLPDGEAPSAMRRTAARFSQMSRAAPKQFEGVLSSISQHLQIWEGPKVESVTRTLDWRPEDFRSAPYPTLYLCIPPSAIDTYAPILRVIVAQHVRQLMQFEQKPGAPILFLLDELPRLGHMEPIRQALEVGRSYGIKLWMIAQYPEQLVHAYPGVGEGMMESCDVRMYMNPSQAQAERISKAFGPGTSLFANSSRALDPSDIVGPEHRESIFVLAANESPLILQKRYHHSGH